MKRTAVVTRETRETRIRIALTLDGSGRCQSQTGLPFMDHMLTLFAKHGFFDLEVEAKGDLEVDAHHTMEDLGIVLGQCLVQALGDKRGIRRYGAFYVPMDETLARAVVDLSGRPCLCYQVAVPVGYHFGAIDVRQFREFFQALVNHAALNLHLDLIRGEDVHHIIEACFKAFARALDQAVSHDPRETSVPSTKGSL